MKSLSDKAVSPVVGVMLMLVVTIIIAAVVSAFAGGIAIDKKAPQATISASYSQSSGMRLVHEGGDTLATGDLKWLVTPGRTFNTQDRMSWYINRSVITNPITNKKWPANSSFGGSSTVTVFSPSDVAIIPAANLSAVQERWYYGALYSDYQSSSFGFANSTNQGKTILVKLIDSNSGKPIAETETVIKP